MSVVITEARMSQRRREPVDVPPKMRYGEVGENAAQVTADCGALYRHQSCVHITKSLVRAHTQTKQTNIPERQELVQAGSAILHSTGEQPHRDRRHLSVCHMRPKRHSDAAGYRLCTHLVYLHTR